MYPYSMDMNISLGNILLTDETYIADLNRNPSYPYKAIMGHVETANEIKTQPEFNKGKSIKAVPIEKDEKRDPLVVLSLNMYNAVEIEYPGYAMKVNIGLKGMRFTFLN